MYCNNCGQKIEENNKYCQNCGVALNLNKDSNVAPIILGVLAIIFCMAPIISIPLAIVSIITGKKSNTTPGVVLGVISIVLTILWTAIVIIILLSFKDIWKEEIFDYTNDYIIEERKQIKEGVTDIKGYIWEGSDQSYLYLNNDNTYIWYADNNNHENNYYQGNYITYNGEAAIKYIANTLKEFGLTEEEQRSFLNDSSNKLENYYLITLTCTKSKINDEEQEGTNNIAYYYGFYSEEKEMLELTNLSTKKEGTFKRKNIVNNIDI